MMKKIALLFTLLCSSLNADPKEEALKRYVCDILPSLPGWCSKEKAMHFIDLVLEVQPQVYVEIGVFGGSSLFPVASALKFLGDGVIIGIDPWDKLEAIRYFDPIKEYVHIQWWASLNLNQIYLNFLDAMHAYDLDESFRIIRSTSQQAVSKVETIDILYIDGNPGDECFQQDVRLYLPKVREGGFIWVNDILSEQRQNGVELLLNACDVVNVIDNGNCVLFKKR